MVDFSHANQTLGRVLYDNVFRRTDATVEFTGTATPGLTPRNAYDWRDFNIFKVLAGEHVGLDVSFDETVSFDCWAIYIETYNALGTTVTLQKEDSAGSGTFTDIDSVVLTDEKFIYMNAFTADSVALNQKIRFDVDAGIDDVNIRQVVVGQKMDAPIGQHGGVKPPTLVSGVVVDNAISVNGSIVGRTFRRVDRKTTISWEPVTPTFVRDTWEPFSKHMVRFACMYQWDPDGYPDEVVMAVAASHPAPENIRAGKMKVQMPLNTLYGELEVEDTADCPTLSGGTLPAGACGSIDGGSF